jgi:hypothetical protein
MRLPTTFLASMLVLGFSMARAQAQEPPPPAAAPPPPPPQYVLTYPQPAYVTPAPRGPWHPGEPAPPGYHVEDKPRAGLVTAGLIVTAIPYAFSVIAATAAQSANESGWLYVPFAGPWVTMGQRSYVCDFNSRQSTGQSLECTGEIFLVMGLIADGVIQAAGGSLLLVGLLATKPELVRDNEGVRIAPMRIGTGYGAGLFGAF